ncbi:MAG: hypothetical protein V8S03_08270 [Faecalimonas umbilicata]
MEEKLKYVKVELVESEEEFDDSYVGQLQRFIYRIKGIREKRSTL